MRIADRIQKPVDRLGAAPAVLLQAVDPGELGKRIDKLGIRILARHLLEAEENIVHVPLPTVGPLEVVTLERLERPLAGPIDPGNAVLERREPAVAAAGLDGDIRP